MRDAETAAKPCHGIGSFFSVRRFFAPLTAVYGNCVPDCAFT
jgi:hypothetical protein